MEVVKAALQSQGAALDKVSVGTVDKNYSYAEVLRCAFALSSQLEKELAAPGKGVNRKTLDGPCIGIMAKPCTEFVASMWAVWLNGAVAVPIALSCPEAEIHHIMTDADISMVIATEEYRELLEKVVETIPAKLCFLPPVSQVENGIDTENMDKILAEIEKRSTLYSGDERALIIYSSGSTGRPKGVVHTQKGLGAQMCGSLALPQPVIEKWEYLTGHRLLETYAMTECGRIESPCVQSSPVPHDMELHSLQTEDEDTLDMTAEMAALGLPSSFIARLDRSPSTRKKSKRKRSASRKLDSFTEIPELGLDQVDEGQLPGVVEVMSKKLTKYWIQRYSLFSRFDEGVKLDEEGWFSVTPEVIAEQQASRCVPDGLVIDAFTGVGGNAIQFALRGHQVIAIDIDPIRVEYARHNAEVYGVADKIEFIVGDFFQLAPFLKADLLFLSPPWGGPEYLKQEIYDLHTMLKPKDGCTLFKVAQSIAPNITLFVPRNVDLNQLQELSWLTSPPFRCEVEENYVNDKLKAITAYYGEIAGEDV